MNAAQAIRLASKMLHPFSSEPENEARLIVAHLADTEPARLILCQKQIDKEDIDKIVELRRKGTPLQYILGKWWFYKYEFLVGDGVLIPRQDTETLVETALELITGKSNPQICDLCSGSGCIAISIAKDRPDATVTAVEKYEAAYKYLLLNTEHNKVGNLTPVMADVTKEAFGEFDLIVSNPPYIPNGDKADLSREVLKEPHTALFGGEDGLCFYRIISEKWKSALKRDGILAFEVGINESDAVAEILRINGFINIGFKNDLIGIPRVVFGTVNNV